MLHDASAELDCDLTGIGKIRRFWTWGSSYPIIIGINILVLNMIMAIIIIMVITIITWGSSYRLGIHPLLQFSAQSWRQLRLLEPTKRPSSGVTTTTATAKACATDSANATAAAATRLLKARLPLVLLLL